SPSPTSSCPTPPGVCCRMGCGTSSWSTRCPPAGWRRTWRCTWALWRRGRRAARHGPHDGARLLPGQPAARGPAGPGRGCHEQRLDGLPAHRVPPEFELPRRGARGPGRGRLRARVPARAHREGARRGPERGADGERLQLPPANADAGGHVGERDQPALPHRPGEPDRALDARRASRVPQEVVRPRKRHSIHRRRRSRGRGGEAGAGRLRRLPGLRPALRGALGQGRAVRLPASGARPASDAARFRAAAGRNRRGQDPGCCQPGAGGPPSWRCRWPRM
ncbi:unnamed protein product, partial [Prorocentrum cordatum]